MNPEIIRAVQFALKATGRKPSRPVVSKPNMAIMLLSGKPKPALYGGQLRANLESTEVATDIEVEEKKVTLLLGTHDLMVTTYVCVRFTSADGVRYTFTVDPIGVVTITVMD